jgi:DNA-binding NtrC family response regulator
LKKPFSSEQLLTRVSDCTADKLVVTPSPNGKTRHDNLSGFERMVGESPAMQSVKPYISQVAATDSTVLITGESGTGKELVAELIHGNSPRKGRQLVCVNCAALPDSLLESELFGYERGAFTGATTSQRGKFELAESGTILLDEIGDMNFYAQAKILRAIESKEIFRLGGNKSIPLNVRIIAATNQDPECLIAEKRFRLDLYYRLNVARIHLPPLRDRKEDILYLLDHSIRDMNRRFGRSVEGFTEEALACLLSYDWPGNVRELKNLCEAIFINLPTKNISFLDLPPLYQKRLKEVAAFHQSERDKLLSALFATHWNVSKAARKLNWSRMTIYRKLEKYQLKKPPTTEDDTPQDVK